MPGRSQLETIYQRLRDHFLISDPGLFRLRMAIRGTLTVGASLISLWKISEFSHRSMVLGFVGVMMAQIGSIAITDRSAQEQKKTILLIPFYASAALTAGVLASPWHWISILLLLVMTYLAIEVRRFGPRGTALGLMSYFAFFASIFFKVPIDELGFVIVSIFVASFFSYVIRFYVVPDKGESMIEWSLAAYRAGLRRFIRVVDREVHTTRASGINRERIRRRMAKVNDLALLSEDSIVTAAEAVTVSGALVRALQGKVFELELSARKIFEAMTERSTHETRAELLVLAEGINVLRAGQRALVEAEGEAAASAGSSKPSARVRDLSARLVSIGGLPSHTRQAIQATIATALATAIGMMVSEDRWYWASLSAYVVFVGATRGDNLRRAAHRLFGTVAGVFAGMLLATALAGHRDLEIAFVFFAIFLGMHAARAAYSWLTFWFTTVIALFYSLLGQLSNEIMYLRLEQTLIGACCGAVVAMVVFPVSTRATLRLEFAKLLRIMSAILTEVSQTSLPRRERRDRVRILERELVALRAVAGPLRWPLGGTGRSETRVLVHAGALITHFTRQLVVFFPDESTVAEAETISSVRVASFLLGERADALAKNLEDGVETDSEEGFDSAHATWTDLAPTPDKDALTYSLARLTQAINALEIRIHAPQRGEIATNADAPRI